MTPTSPAGLGEEIEGRVTELLDLAGARGNRDLLRDIIVTGLSLARIDASRLDLKIAASALDEMERAFELFSHYRGLPKLTMFGSVRTAVSDPLYAQALDLAARMAHEKWLVVTGAGPGIMAAGADGAVDRTVSGHRNNRSAGAHPVVSSGVGYCLLIVRQPAGAV